MVAPAVLGWWEKELTREYKYMRGNEFEPAGLGLWPRNPDHAVCTASVTVTLLTLNTSNTVAPQGAFPCPFLGCLEPLRLRGGLGGARVRKRLQKGARSQPPQGSSCPLESLLGCGARCPPTGVAEGERQEVTGKSGAWGGAELWVTAPLSELSTPVSDHPFT